MSKKQLQEDFQEEKYFEDIDNACNKNSDDDEVDPLDAYMLGIQQEVIKEKQQPKIKQQEEIFENEDPIETQMDSIKKSLLQKHQKNATDAPPDFLDSDGDVNFDELGKKKKTIEALPALNHNEVDYQEFAKDFYQVHEDIQQLDQQQIIKIRKEYQITVKGNHVPTPIISFAHLNFDQKLIDKISSQKFTKPTAIQSQALPCLLQGRNIIGVAKTGSGKTVAYVWPMLIHVADQRAVEIKEGPIAIVILPTRELGQQVYMETKKYAQEFKISVAALLGGENKHFQWKELRSGVDIIVATPGRLIEMIKKKATNMHRCTYVVIDEADSLFSLGFEQQIRSILGQIRPDRQISLFTATMKKKVKQLCVEMLEDPIVISVGEGDNQVNEDIKQIPVIVEKEEEKLKWLQKNMENFLAKGKVLIFVAQIGQCEQLLNDLKPVYNGLTLHGDKIQHERTQIINQFKTKINLLIATDVASRGLDIKEIRTVINYFPPKNADIYIHRIGRTGRAGNTDGVAYSLVTKDDWKLAILLIKNLELAGQVVPTELEEIATIDPGFKMDRMKKKMGFEFAKGRDASRMLQQALKRQQNTKAGIGFDEQEPKKEKKVQIQQPPKPTVKLPVTLAEQTGYIGQFKNKFQDVNPYDNLTNYAAAISRDDLDRDSVIKHYQTQMRDQFRSGFISAGQVKSSGAVPTVKFLNKQDSNKQDSKQDSKDSKK
ncbi:hypothetical protein pb186bvf_012003 [Paramecium bursaria]